MFIQETGHKIVFYKMGTEKQRLGLNHTQKQLVKSYCTGTLLNMIIHVNLEIYSFKTCNCF